MKRHLDVTWEKRPDGGWFTVTWKYKISVLDVDGRRIAFAHADTRLHGWVRVSVLRWKLENGRPVGVDPDIGEA